VDIDPSVPPNPLPGGVLLTMVSRTQWDNPFTTTFTFANRAFVETLVSMPDMCGLNTGSIAATHAEKSADKS
jgi:hypothetical protein